MARPLIIAPSILAADFARLGDEVRAIDAAGADWIHIDVMDGHFVPNLTIGPSVVKALRPYSPLPFDVHLMVSCLDVVLDPFIEAGADIITIHTEATPHVHRYLQHIRKHGKKAGLSLNPGTSLSTLDHLLDDIDLILIMTVNPGFGGQKFIPAQLEKIQTLKHQLDAYTAKTKRVIDLEVDGGITQNTAKQVIQAGATALVAGTAVFGSSHGKNYTQAIQDLRP